MSRTEDEVLDVEDVVFEVVDLVSSCRGPTT